jgi:spore maturation protein CgeB
MRILVVDTMYPAFLSRHYAERPGLADEAYDVQWRALMNRFFGTADSYSHYLRELGHAAHELVINCEPLQARWAREHNVRRRPWRHPFGLVLDQADEFRPDVVYVQDLSALPQKILRLLRRDRLLAGQIASEPPAADCLLRFDLLMSSFPHFVQRFRELGIDSEYFRIGFDPRVLMHLDQHPQREGAVFVGSLGPSQHGRGNRVLEQAAASAPIRFWGRGVEELAATSAIRRNYRGEAWGIDMFNVLRRARVTLNRHIDVAEGYANNMRLFEATGVGSLLLTDEGRNLSELFEPGREVATYRDAADLAKKVKRFLADEEERAAVASAGQRRTLEEHTYALRMRELVELLAKRL